MKRCYKCHNEKEFREFYFDKSKKDGLDTKCKSCRDAYYKLYSERNRLSISERQKAWWKKKHETS